MTGRRYRGRAVNARNGAAEGVTRQSADVRITVNRPSKTQVRYDGVIRISEKSRACQFRIYIQINRMIAAVKISLERSTRSGSVAAGDNGRHLLTVDGFGYIPLLNVNGMVLIGMRGRLRQVGTDTPDSARKARNVAGQSEIKALVWVGGINRRAAFVVAAVINML